MMLLMDTGPQIANTIPTELKNRSRWKTAWKAVTITGGVLTLLGYGFNGVAYSTRFHPPMSWLGGNMICVLVGVACLTVGQVGWTLLLDKAGRARITAFGFAFPIALALIGTFSAHGDSHGSFPIFFLPLYPLIPVAFILLWLW
jgi:hypothetical protein